MGDVMAEIMGVSEGGTARRQSTTGLRMQRRILNAQHKKEEELKTLSEDQFSGALIAGLNAIPDLPVALKELMLLFRPKDGSGEFDEEEVCEAKKLVEEMLEKKRA